MDVETRIAAIRMALLRDDREATNLYYDSATFRYMVDSLAGAVILLMPALVEEAKEIEVRLEQVNQGEPILIEPEDA